LKIHLKSIVQRSKNWFVSQDSFDISITDFRINGRSIIYNSIIREKVPMSFHGVYIISDTDSKEILYVGMSGQIKRLDNGEYGNGGYDIRKRLVSSRKKDEDGQDVSSSDFFESEMKKESIDSITITILKTKNGVSPTF
jgi:hypothetical protein